MHIGIFGGSFDPVHIEHVRLVEYAVQTLGLDKLYVIPAFAPPHKKGKVLSADTDRLAMCRLAFSKVEKVEVCDYEIQKQGTSYTYLTAQYFKSLYPNDRLYWLVGTDMLRDFPTWRHPEIILDCVTLAVCARAEMQDWVTQEQANFMQRFGKMFAVIGYNASDVSSTKIRVLAGAGMRLTPYTTEEVEVFIKEKGLYFIPFAKEALALQSEKRRAHSVRVAYMAAKGAARMHIPERQAITAALFHDVAKDLKRDDFYLQGFCLYEKWGDVPNAVWHQFAGAYLAQTHFHIQDEEILNAIRFHTSGRADMQPLEKLIYLADMLEEGRQYEGVDELRALFDQGKMDECLKACLCRSIAFVKEKGERVYPLTLQAKEFYQ